MWHADEAETSVALSLYPDKVHMDLAVPGKAHGLIDSQVEEDRARPGSR